MISVLITFFLVLSSMLILGKHFKDDGLIVEKKISFGIITSIVIFIILPYVNFYLQLLNTNQNLVYAFLAIIFVGFLFITEKIITMDFVEMAPVVSVILMLSFLIPSLIYGADFKNFLVEQTDFFSSPVRFNQLNNKRLTEKIHSYNNHYMISIPESWGKNYKKGVDDITVALAGNNNKIQELRIDCNMEEYENITQTVKRWQDNFLTKNETMDYQCFRWRENKYACKFRYKDNVTKMYKKILWLATDNITHHRLILEFKTNTNDIDDLMLIDSVFNSIKFTKKEKHTGNCKPLL